MNKAALEAFIKAGMREQIATVVACDERANWEVEITRKWDGGFEVCGRSTRLTVYLTKTLSGYLVSVPEYHRCGIIPAAASYYDIMEYVRIENKVDAATLAAAVRHLIAAGFAFRQQPSL